MGDPRRIARAAILHYSWKGMDYMMRCKKILPLLLTGTIALSLAACSGGKTAESPAPAPATESRSEETVQSIEETPETNGDRYIGEYTDPDSGSVEMEIAENEDGTYVVQIGIYRLTELSDGVGTLEADGLRFTATDANGNPISGVITVNGDEATITFTDSTWPLLPNGEQFTYARTSDQPALWEDSAAAP